MKMVGVKSLTVKAAILNAVLFSLFFIYANPEYYFDEDVTALYLLAGGFGDLPTELLHYDYGLNPIVGYPLKFLFAETRGINWYAISLIGLQFISFTSILTCFLNRLKTHVAICIYVVLFVIFESWLLMSFGFNSTSLALTTAGIVKLFEWRLTGTKNSGKIYSAIIFFVLASFFRMHVMLPLIGMSLPFIFLPFNKKIAKQLILIYLVTTVLIFGFNQFHKAYYSATIPNWQTEEDYRQLIYTFYNDTRTRHYSGDKYKMELDFIQMGLPKIPGLLTKAKLTEMYSDVKMNSFRSLSKENNFWYWFFINLRLFIYVFLFIGGYFFYRSSYSIISILSLLLLLSGLYILGYFANTSAYLIVSGILLWLILFTLSFGDKFKSPIENYVFIFLCSLFIVWGLIRLQKMSALNTVDREKNDAYFSYIKQHPGNLFINTMGVFSIRKLSIFADPRDFLLRNVLDSEHLIMELYPGVLNRFNISTFDSIPLSSRVIFFGEPKPSLINYFKSLGYKLNVVDVSVENCRMFTIKAY